MPYVNCQMFFFIVRYLHLLLFTKSGHLMLSVCTFSVWRAHLLPVQEHTRQTSAYGQKLAQTSKLSFHRHHHCQIMLFPPKIIQKKKNCTTMHSRQTNPTDTETVSSMFPSLLFMLRALEEKTAKE